LRATSVNLFEGEVYRDFGAALIVTGAIDDSQFAHSNAEIGVCNDPGYHAVLQRDDAMGQLELSHSVLTASLMLSVDSLRRARDASWISRRPSWRLLPPNPNGATHEQ
jgi:hypothetical protein